MSARAAKRSALSGALKRSDLHVVAARGREIEPGHVEWSGVLLVQNLPLARFRNDGSGGCCVYDVRPNAAGRALFAEVEALAKTLFPEIKFEQTDHLVGALWDEAVLAGR